MQQVSFAMFSCVQQVDYSSAKTLRAALASLQELRYQYVSYLVAGDHVTIM